MEDDKVQELRSYDTMLVNVIRDLCDKIMVLESVGAKRDTFYVEYRMKVDEEFKALTAELEAARRERDALATALKEANVYGM